MKLHAVGLAVSAWASGPKARSLGGTSSSKSPPRTPPVPEECLPDRMPQFQAWGRGADEVPKHVTQYKKNPLCAGKVFEAGWNRTNDET